jgi:hypothetical protein
MDCGSSLFLAHRWGACCPAEALSIGRDAKDVNLRKL